jgi:hypothetical protein
MNINFAAYSADEFLAVADFCKRMAEIRSNDPHRVDPTRPDVVRFTVDQFDGSELSPDDREMVVDRFEPRIVPLAAEEVDPPKKPRGRPKKETTIDATPEEPTKAQLQEAADDVGEPEPQPEEPAEKAYTIDDVTVAITTLSEKFSSDRALAVLNEFDARSRKTLDEAKYGAFCRRADELLAGAK